MCLRRVDNAWETGTLIDGDGDGHGETAEGKERSLDDDVKAAKH
jgi:hypothetical protein